MVKTGMFQISEVLNPYPLNPEQVLLNPVQVLLNSEEVLLNPGQ